jgi:23S rRNA pseudouridine1911/1915/1917 synthase
MASQYSIEEKNIGERLDKYLTGLNLGETRSAVVQWIDKGAVLVNAKVATKNYRLKAGDVVKVEIPPLQDLAIEAQNIPLDIIFEDDQLLVVNKPQGMVVHPAAGNREGTLVNALLAHCGDSLSGINGVIRPGIVHRIDKDTSGLLMVAKTNQAHLSLAAQIKDHSFTRVYEAVVYGRLKTMKGDINAPIGRHKVQRKKMCVTDVNSKEALTHYEVIEQLNGFCHVQCRLYTGRTHQIRVHMAYIGHPVVGDPLYGPRKDKLGLNGQLLHAKTLGFVHPVTGAYMEFSAPLPEYFERFMKSRHL